MKISACMIAKNESRCIARCIESYERIVDEIIVVDTGSEDDTVAIAEAHGAKVFHFEWVNDFSKARNFALDQCTGDWIIFLDADEYLQEDQDLTLKEAIINRHGDLSTHGLLTFMSNIEPLPGRSDEYRIINDFECVRAFRNSPHLRYKNAIHEALQHDKKTMMLYPVPIDKINILHDGYRSAVGSDKASRNMQALLQDYESDTRTPLTPFYIGREYCTLHEFEKAIPYFEEYIQEKTWHKFIGLWGHRLLLYAYTQTGVPAEKCMEFVRQTLKDFPDNPTAELIMGEQLNRTKDLVGAVEHFEKALWMLGDNPREYQAFALEFTADSYNKVLNRLGRAALLRADESAAFEYFLRGIQFDRSYKPNLSVALWILRKQGDAAVLAFIEQHYDLNRTKHLSLLTNTLRQKRPGVPFLTCFEKYYQRIQRQDVNFLTMLNVIGEHQMAFDGYLKRYKSMPEDIYLFKAFLSAAQAGNDVLLQKLADAAPDYAPFIQKYQQPGIDIEVPDIAYMLLFREALSLMSAQSPPVVRLMQCLPSQQTAGIAYILNEFGEYDTLLKIAEDVYAGTIQTDIPGEFYYQATYAAIQAGDTALASKYYQSALENRYPEHAMALFTDYIDQHR